MPTDEEWRQGRRRLRDLLPAARAHYRNGSKMTKPSPIFAATAPYVREDNFYALVVYPAPLGGWHCDLMLKETPPGISNAMGSPAAQPLGTKAEAETMALALLCMALAVQDQYGNSQMPAGKPVFWLNDVVCDLIPAFYEKALPHMPPGYNDDRDVINARVAKMLDDVFPEIEPANVSLEHVHALSERDRAKMLAVLHMAAPGGVFTYPPRLDASPSGHREQSQARH